MRCGRRAYLLDENTMCLAGVRIRPATRDARFGQVPVLRAKGSRPRQNGRVAHMLRPVLAFARRPHRFARKLRERPEQETKARPHSALGA